MPSGEPVDYDVQPSDPGPDPVPQAGSNSIWVVILKLLGLV